MEAFKARLTSVKVDQWLQRNLSRDVAFGLRLLHLLLLRVVAVDVGAVVLVVVELHDLTRDRWL
jgi:hypothetical protein